MSFPIYRSKVVPLLQSSFVCASVFQMLLFVYPLFVPHFCFLWCLGRTVLRDCDISWVSYLIFLRNTRACRKQLKWNYPGKMQTRSTAFPNIKKTRVFKYIENFTSKKWKFSAKNSDILHISAQNIDCRYSLEPPCRGGSNEYPQSMFWV